MEMQNWPEKLKGKQKWSFSEMKKIIKDPQNAAGDGRQENQTVKYCCCGKNKKTKTEITWVLRTPEAPVNLMLVLPLTPPSPYLPNIFSYNTRSNIGYIYTKWHKTKPLGVTCLTCPSVTDWELVSRDPAADKMIPNEDAVWASGIWAHYLRSSIIMATALMEAGRRFTTTLTWGEPMCELLQNNKQQNIQLKHVMSCLALVIFSYFGF